MHDDRECLQIQPLPPLSALTGPPGSHPLLAQLPLTVSPFVSLPNATTLPYTYKSLPSTLPQSITDPPPPPPPAGGPAGTPDPAAPAPSSDMTQPKAQYVLSESTGHAAHPDDIIGSCQALQAHLAKMQSESQELVERWTSEIRARDLAEKRRVAPGWLDVEERLLVPEKVGQAQASDRPADGSPVQVGDVVDGVQRLELDGQGTAQESRAGEELDRAFGGMR